MKKHIEIEYLDIEKNIEYNNLIEKVIKNCFEIENLENTNLYISIILTNLKNIKDINNKYRNINKETDVISFPMFEKEEIIKITNTEVKHVLGDIIISIEKVQEQAKEYGHSFERELAYMVVHGFYHIMGEDHVQKIDKEIMRKKEEEILNKLNFKRNK